MDILQFIKIYKDIYYTIIKLNQKANILFYEDNPTKKHFLMCLLFDIYILFIILYLLIIIITIIN